MYLAILALLANEVTKTTAFWYLVYYNVIFVLPLIIITLLFMFGLEADKLQQYMETHKKKARLIIGIALLIIGALLLIL
jgi:cytochrome c biogenesis protein CcdA